MDCVFKTGHDVFVVIANVNYPCSGNPNFVGVSIMSITTEQLFVLCATSISARGYPSSVVRPVFMFTPC